MSAVSRFKQIMAKPLACDPKLLATGIVLGRLTARFAQFMRQLIQFVPNRLLVHETASTQRFLDKTSPGLRGSMAAHTSPVMASSGVSGLVGLGGRASAPRRPRGRVAGRGAQ